MWLLVVAAFGFVVPNGFFIHWLLTGDKSLDAVLGNELALGFILDCALAMVLLAWLFAVRPIGRVRWPWFVVLSLAGGLGFSIPLYLWLNRRSSGDPKASFGAWWRGAGLGLLVVVTLTAAGTARAAELRRFTLDDETPLLLQHGGERSAGAGRGSVEDVPLVEVTRKDGGAVRLPARRARDVRAGASA